MNEWEYFDKGMKSGNSLVITESLLDKFDKLDKYHQNLSSRVDGMINKLTNSSVQSNISNASDQDKSALKEGATAEYNQIIGDYNNDIRHISIELNSNNKQILSELSDNDREELNSTIVELASEYIEQVTDQSYTDGIQLAVSDNLGASLLLGEDIASSDMLSLVGFENEHLQNLADHFTEKLPNLCDKFIDYSILTNGSISNSIMEASNQLKAYAQNNLRSDLQEYADLQMTRLKLTAAHLWELFENTKERKTNWVRDLASSDLLATATTTAGSACAYHFLVENATIMGGIGAGITALIFIKPLLNTLIKPISRAIKNSEEIADKNRFEKSMFILGAALGTLKYEIKKRIKIINQCKSFIKKANETMFDLAARKYLSAYGPKLSKTEKHNINKKIVSDTVNFSKSLENEHNRETVIANFIILENKKHYKSSLVDVLELRKQIANLRRHEITHLNHEHLLQVAIKRGL